ncbi:Cytochrome P450 81Q32-like protein [Drosera capensis]
MEVIFSLILFLITSFLLLRHHSSTSKHKHHQRLPPTPPCLPIIGHLHFLGRLHHRSLHTLSLRYGPILRLRLGHLPVLLVSSPSTAQQCFTTNDIIFANRPRLLAGHHLGYNYTALPYLPYGPHCRTLRRVIANLALSSHQLQVTSHIREQETTFMMKNIIDQITTKNVSVGQKRAMINLRTYLDQLVYNVIMRMINGKRWRDSGELFPLSSAMSTCDFLPELRWVFGLEEKVMKLRDRRDVLFQGIIDEARSAKGQGGGEGTTKTMVEGLLELQRKEPEYFTDDILKGILLVMISAGTDTTARTIEWAMSLLLNHPHILLKLRLEIDSITAAAAATPRLLLDNDLPSLPYLRSVLSETLRLYPAAPLLVPHLSSSPSSISGYHVDANTILLVNAWAIHRSEESWTDALVFRPERWNDEQEDGELALASGFRYLPFGVGRRTCPGSGLAMREIMLGLGRLVQGFEWERVGEELVSLEEEGGLVMAKKEPLVAVCTPRVVISDLIFAELDVSMSGL